MKRILCLTVTLVMAVMGVSAETSLDSGNYDISWYNPEETEFMLTSSKQIAGIAYLVNNGYDSFKGKSIKLNKGSIWTSINSSWIPIGTPNRPFQGKFDANGVRTTDFKFRIENGSGTGTPLGLFGTVRNAVIENISLSDNYEWLPTGGSKVIPTINLDCYSTEINAGVIAGEAYDTKFIECSVYATIDIKSTASQAKSYIIRCGGLVGYAGNCEFVNCDMWGNIDVLLKSGTYGAYYTSGTSLSVGGILGSGRDISMKGCSTGWIRWGEEDKAPSIMVGRAPSKNNCSTPSFIGGLAGSLSGKSTIEGCQTEMKRVWTYSYTAESSTSSLIWDRYIGGLVGMMSTSYGYGIYNSYSAAELYNTGYNATEGGIAGAYPENNDWGGNFSWSTKSYGYNGGYNGATSFKSREQMTTDTFLDELNLWPQIKRGEKTWVRVPHLGENDDYGLPKNVSYVNSFYTVIDGFRYWIKKETEESRLSYWWGSPHIGVSYPGLESAQIPTSVKWNGTEYPITELGASFWNNSTLRTVDIPGCVTRITHSTFENCSSLEKITCRALTPPEVKEDAFTGIDKAGITLVVDNNVVDAYRQHEIWGQLNVIGEDLGVVSTGIIPTKTEMKPSEYYDLNGREVKHPLPGQIVITAGKKIIVSGR